MMIRAFQTAGPTVKIVLGAILLIICGSMVVTLIPGGLGSSFGISGPGQGVVARVAGDQVTTLEVQRETRQMLRQEFTKGGVNQSYLIAFFTFKTTQNHI